MLEFVTVPLTAYRLAQVGRASAAGQITSWQMGGRIVGVIGPERVINAVIRYGAGLASGAASLDAEAAREIVALAQARVPQRTGLSQIGLGRRSRVISHTRSAYRSVLESAHDPVRHRRQAQASRQG